jgi:hypothetical protein
MKSLIPIFSFLLFISSCTSPYVTEIQIIDSLSVSLEKAKIQLKSLDTGMVFRNMREVEKNVGLIVKHKDSIGKEEVILVEEYQIIRRNYEKLTVKLPTFYEDIETIPVQLSNLKKDLSKNLIPDEKAHEYLANEMTAAESMIEAVTALNKSLDNLNKRFDVSQEKILHLIQSLDSTTVEKES